MSFGTLFAVLGLEETERLVEAALPGRPSCPEVWEDKGRNGEQQLKELKGGMPTLHRHQSQERVKARRTFPRRADEQVWEWGSAGFKEFK